MQALNIPTKINKGCVEIVSDVHLVKQSEKVGGSEATLLAKLGIKPFSYGLVIQKVPPSCPMHPTESRRVPNMIIPHVLLRYWVRIVG